MEKKRSSIGNNCIITSIRQFQYSHYFSKRILHSAFFQKVWFVLRGQIVQHLLYYYTQIYIATPHLMIHFASEKFQFSERIRTVFFTVCYSRRIPFSACKLLNIPGRPSTKNSKCGGRERGANKKGIKRKGRNTSQNVRGLQPATGSCPCRMTTPSCLWHTSSIYQQQ